MEFIVSLFIEIFMEGHVEVPVIGNDTNYRRPCDTSEWKVIRSCPC